MAFIGSLIPVATDSEGRNLPDARLYTYEAGTLTEAPTYSDQALTVENSFPVVSDGAGRFFDVYLPDGNYKFKLVDKYGTEVWVQDDIRIVGTVQTVVTTEVDAASATEVEWTGFPDDVQSVSIIFYGVSGDYGSTEGLQITVGNDDDGYTGYTYAGSVGSFPAADDLFWGDTESAMLIEGDVSVGSYNGIATISRVGETENYVVSSVMRAEASAPSYAATGSISGTVPISKIKIDSSSGAAISSGTIAISYFGSSATITATATVPPP